MRIFEGVAQLAEYRSFKSGVRGSNPFTLTIGTIAITHTYSFFLVQLIKVLTGIISSFELVSIIAAIVPFFRRDEGHTPSLRPYTAGRQPFHWNLVGCWTFLRFLAVFYRSLI